jgi:hypothetical protein
MRAAGPGRRPAPASLLVRADPTVSARSGGAVESVNRRADLSRARVAGHNHVETAVRGAAQMSTGCPLSCGARAEEAGEVNAC